MENFLQPGYYEEILDSLPKDNHFLPFSVNYNKSHNEIKILKKFLKHFGNFYEVRALITSREFAEKYDKPEYFIFVFIDNEGKRKWYDKNRFYFISNTIPTQFVKAEEVPEKFDDIKLIGIKSNILLEMMTKMDRKPIALIPSDNILATEGFLCLSDIKSTGRKLFGALITYSKGIEKDEEVQIYRGIDFTLGEEVIQFPNEDKLFLLAEKIKLLIARERKIDLLITKRWKIEDLSKLIGKLKNNGIEINRAYYLSSKTARFVDDFVIEKHFTNTLNPYIIINEKVAFLRSSTYVRIFPDLSQLFIELMWPSEGTIQPQDLKKILWLVKKRLYRIQEFGVLKLPEPMYMFDELGKMVLDEISEKSSIPLRLLI